MARRTPVLVFCAMTFPLFFAVDAAAQSFRCVGKDGKRYYGQTIPRQCIGQRVEQLNDQGLVVKRIDPQGSAAERAAKEAEDKKQREKELAEREELRRNRALLATYTSVKDIEDQRARSLAENADAIKEVDAGIAKLKETQTRLTGLMRAKKANKEPVDSVAQQLKNVEIDLKAQEGLRSAKQKEVAAINAKYDEDKKRYLDITSAKR